MRETAMAAHLDSKGRPIVAVTGMGIVTSLGQGKADNWAALTEGRSGIHRITRFPIDHLATTICGMVDFLPSSTRGCVAHTYELARLAAEEAVAEAKIAPGALDGPLFLAAPPVEMDWRQRLQLFARTKPGDGEGYSAMIAAALRGEGADLFEE